MPLSHCCSHENTRGGRPHLGQRLLTSMEWQAMAVMFSANSMCRATASCHRTTPRKAVEHGCRPWVLPPAAMPHLWARANVHQQPRLLAKREEWCAWIHQQQQRLRRCKMCGRLCTSMQPVRKRSTTPPAVTRTHDPLHFLFSLSLHNHHPRPRHTLRLTTTVSAPHPRLHCPVIAH